MNHSGHYSAGTICPDCLTDIEAPKVLVIDDDPNILHALKRRFSKYEVNLLLAYHGAHGIWLATTEIPDLVITDISMPQGQGQDVVECLKSNAQTSHIPIFVLTGICDDRLRRRLRNSGIAAYLTKPLDFCGLCKAMGRVIDLKERADSE